MYNVSCLLYSQLTEVNDAMAEYTAGFSLGQPNGTQLHMLQRHRDILQGYSHEFSKTKVTYCMYKFWLMLRFILQS